MKRNSVYVWLVALAGLALAGCGPHDGALATDEEPIEIGPKYSAKDGLLVPDDTRRSLGVRLEDVEERQIPGTIEVQLRVVLAGQPSALASALVAPEQAARLKPGQAVRVRANDETLAGRVTRVNGELELATGMAEVLVEVDRPLTSSGLTAGAFLPATIELGTDPTVMAIPRGALLECSDGQWVYTVNGGYLVRAPVQTGAVGGDYVEITDGLYAGDQVVAHGAMSLWMTELAAVKGGQACCILPPKGR